MGSVFPSAPFSLLLSSAFVCGSMDKQLKDPICLPSVTNFTFGFHVFHLKKSEISYFDL